MAELISPEDMVRPKAIAPFEVQYAFAAWVQRWSAEKPLQVFRDGGTRWRAMALEAVDGFGPPFPLSEERPTDFGLRAAAALFHFIKES